MEYPGRSRIKIKCLVLGATDSGKTAILRRYYHKTFHPDSRLSTLGTDFYTARVKNPFYCSNVSYNETSKLFHEVEDHAQHQKQNNSLSLFSPGKIDPSLSFSQQRFLILQMWDTPGRERIPSQNKSNDTFSLSEFFFRKVDAAMLVYDINSSTSFTQLLKFYAELIELMNFSCKKSGDYECHCNFPILIVANKSDIFHKKRDWIRAIQRASMVSQRDVMGLKGEYRGKDLPYEYRIALPEEGYPKTKQGRSSMRNKEHRYERTTFMATADRKWTTDESYLNALLLSEDGSHPDRDMVLLWCKRNGLKHAEVSALDGTGIDDAIDELIRLALESKIELGGSEKLEHVETYVDFRPNEELDVFKRYSPEQNRCFRFLSMFHW